MPPAQPWSCRCRHPGPATHAPISPPAALAPSTPTARAEADVPVVDSIALLGSGREVLIRHSGECYRLRHTRNDKLILTK